MRNICESSICEGFALVGVLVIWREAPGVPRLLDDTHGWEEAFRESIQLVRSVLVWPGCR